MKQFLRDFLYLLDLLNENDPIVKDYRDIVNKYKKEHEINFRGITANKSKFKKAISSYNENISKLNDKITELSSELNSQSVEIDKSLPNIFLEHGESSLEAISRALSYAKIGKRKNSDIYDLIKELENHKEEVKNTILSKIESISSVEEKKNSEISKALDEIIKSDLKEQQETLDNINKVKAAKKANREYDKVKQEAVIKKLQDMKTMPNRFGTIWSEAYGQYGNKLDLGNGVSINAKTVRRTDAIKDELSRRYALGTLKYTGYKTGQGMGSFHNLNPSKYTNPTPLLGLPQFSEQELRQRELKHNVDNSSPILGLPSNEPDKPDIDSEELKRRERRRQNAMSRARGKGAYQVAHTGSPDAIILGSPSSNQAANVSSFEEEKEKEDDAKNRRRFVADLATAILAAHKKNPIVDLLKWAVLIMGKHLPVLSAALITLAPLVGIFKGIRALSYIRTAMTGGKVAKNAPLAARLISGFRGSNSLKALFGFGPKSIGSQLTKNVGAQIVNGYRNNGGIRGAISYGARALGVNMQSLPLVQKSAGLFANVAKWGGRLGRHPQWVGAIARGGAGRALAGAGRLALGAAKFGLRGIASPLMMAIDGFRGFMDTRGGKWWQRVLGVLLKILTLGFMSGKKIREIVGMKETEMNVADKANNDEERRHQERIGWWDRFWAWLKNIVPWGKKDGVDNKASEKVNKELKKDAEKLDKKNQEIDKKLGTTYTKGTKEYETRRGALYHQYIMANKKRGGNIAQRLGFGEQDPELVKEANAWADKMMNEEAYKLKMQKVNNTNEANRINAVLDNKLPENLTSVTQHGVDSVALKNMGLKGSIWSENSVPYIAAANAGNLKALDNYMAANGHNFIYTSAMGGHDVGTGHWKGNKVDVQTQGSVLTPEEYKRLYKLGYFGGKTGAVGYEYNGKKTITSPQEYEKLYKQGKVNMSNGNHYDFTVANGVQAYLDAQSEKKIAKEAESKTEVDIKEKEQATSEIRKGLAELVGAKDRNSKQERTRNIVLSAVDVTGSLGVWGITQLNNGVMRTGR